MVKHRSYLIKTLKLLTASTATGEDCVAADAWTSNVTPPTRRITLNAQRVCMFAWPLLYSACKLHQSVNLVIACCWHIPEPLDLTCPSFICVELTSLLWLLMAHPNRNYLAYTIGDGKALLPCCLLVNCFLARWFFVDGIISLWKWSSAFIEFAYWTIVLGVVWIVGLCTQVVYIMLDDVLNKINFCNTQHYRL